MYTQFFSLNEKPFAITPDPRYLFMSERHGEGLAHLVYGVTESGGFIQLTGEVGTGKTTLVRTLLGKLPDEVDIALILNPQVTVVEFLQTICQELEVPPPDDRSSAMALVDALNRYLLDAHSRGRRTILLVDEAQNLTSKQMKTLITRVGPGSKMICLGNVGQIDTPYITETTSGLTYVIDKIKNWEHSGHITLTRGERSRLAGFASTHL